MSEEDDANLETLLTAMEGIGAKVKAAMHPYAPLPVAGSLASQEREAVKGDEFRLRLIWEVPLRASVSLKIAAEAVEGTARLLRPSALFFMPGPVVRAGVEASGLILWLMEEGISIDARLQRAIAVQKAALDDDRKLSQDGQRDGSPESKAVLDYAVTWSDDQRQKFFEAASKVGLKAIPVPPNTDLAALCGARYEYNLTSGLAHGNLTAYGAIEKMFLGQGPDGVQSAGVVFFMYATTVADAYSRALWALARYVLNDEGVAAIAALLEQFYDELHIRDEARFWRQA